MSRSSRGLPESVMSRIPAESVAFRKTFLRAHIPDVLGDIREVLAVKELADRPGRPLTVDDRAWLLDQFFDVDEPSKRVWIPVAIEGRGLAGSSKRVQTLTDLLANLDGRSDALILLKARTGAGKTLSSFKAFRDCFLPVADLQTIPEPGERRSLKPPPLAGYLPLRLPVTATVAVKAAMRKEGGGDWVAEEQAPRLLRELILHAARLDPTHWKSVDEWIRHGPPLLLFADLNAADDLTRRSLAFALAQWQTEHGQGKRHRVVVTYRSAIDDAVVNTLRRLTPSRVCDLLPVDAEQARNYLIGYRELERRFFEKRLDCDPPRRTLSPDVEAESLGRLVAHHSRDQKSLISTPLLMHFATTLKEGLDQIDSISDLYDRVVDESLKRDLGATEDDSSHHVAVGDYDRPAGRTWPGPLRDPLEGARIAKVVMTRVALAILATNPNDTRLTPPMACRLVDHFGQLVKRPESQPRNARWAHPDGFWSEGPYQTEEYRASKKPLEEKAFLDALLEIGLFRRDAETLGFVHDSLLYYFAGKVALRDYLGPGLPSRNHDLYALWPLRVAERIRDDPAAWELSGQFLGASLRPEELRNLAVEMLAVLPRVDSPGLAPVLHGILRGRQGQTTGANGSPVEPILAELEKLTWRGEGRRHPEALASMGMEWVRDALPQSSESFVLDLRRSLSHQCRDWPWSFPPVHRPHSQTR